MSHPSSSVQDSSQAIHQARRQYREATPSACAATGQRLNNIIEAQAHTTEADLRAAAPSTEQWTQGEVDAANTLLRARGFPTISLEDTTFWYVKDADSVNPRITFFATPACTWAPGHGRWRSCLTAHSEHAEGAGRCGQGHLPSTPRHCGDVGRTVYTLCPGVCSGVAEDGGFESGGHRGCQRIGAHFCCSNGLSWRFLNAVGQLSTA